MSKYEFMIAMAGIFCGAWVFREMIRSRHERWRHRLGKTNSGVRADNEAAAEKLKAMEERIKVLEKIITDREADLRRKFRDLEEADEG